jgi:hypothetical protein
MLGQTCHARHYNDSRMENQTVRCCNDVAHTQAFVLHCRHTSACIYFAELPNEYLKTIASMGTKYNQQSKFPIQVCKTKSYDLRKADDLVAFVKLLVHLIRHLASGNAQSIYLFNDGTGTYPLQVNC